MLKSAKKLLVVALSGFMVSVAAAADHPDYSPQNRYDADYRIVDHRPDGRLRLDSDSRRRDSDRRDYRDRRDDRRDRWYGDHRHRYPDYRWRRPYRPYYRYWSYPRYYRDDDDFWFWYGLGFMTPYLLDDRFD